MALSPDMSAAQATEVVNSLLDSPENRFPLSFNSDLPRIRELFHAATRNQWDPKTDIAWDKLDADAYTPEQRDAARLYWSRRAWSEYGAISESPALQVRFVFVAKIAEGCQHGIRRCFAQPAEAALADGVS